MPSVKCAIETCTYQTPDLDNSIVAILLTTHATTHSASTPAGATPKVESVKRPTITSAGTIEDWQYFTSRWEEYVAATRVTGRDRVLQLLECCDDGLRKDLTRSTIGTLLNKSEADVLEAIKSLAVREENIMVCRVSLNNMKQDRDETVRSFCARLRGQASVCRYIIQCQHCQHDVNYMEPILRDALCRGIEDTEIQLDLLSHINQELTLNEVIHFVEAKEAGKRTAGKLLENHNSNAFRSTYKRVNSDASKLHKQDQPTDIPCSYCGKKGHGEKFTPQQRRTHCPAYNHTCSLCNRLHHFEEVCRSKDKPKTTIRNKQHKSEQQGAVFDTLCSVSTHSITADHHTYNKPTNRWKRRPSSPQPFIQVSVRVEDQDYLDLGHPPIINHPSRTIKLPAMADTGCQSCLVGFKAIQQLGLTKHDLLPANMKMHAANEKPINILGAVILRVSGTSPNNKVTETRQMTYVTNDSTNLFLSKTACIDLGMISCDFPTVGEVTNSAITADSPQCNCPKRELPPPIPTKLPFPAIPENRQRLQEHLLDYYKSSTFNTCEHQPLPLMTGPPLKLRVDPDAKPVASHSPIPVPVHWQEKVKADLDRDVRLGVIEPVPVGEPVTWCHRMVICSKKNGEPRRTVDFQPLNAHATRETHHTPSPFHQVRSVPENVKKTVSDAWNGYHSVPLCFEDRHYTTFITPWGRYRYRTTPQGYIASGDAYTRRFDEIASDFTNKIKVIDDTLLWEDTLEKSFFQAAKWLELCGRNGIIQNPQKFILGADTVEFSGFKIAPDTVQPSDNVFQAIADFPTPNNITDVRSWFGLVNQVAYTFSMAKHMQPFRELLKPKTTFYWDDELQQIFEVSKREIIKEIEDGVRIFDKSKPTCLATDWSKMGIGFWLFQKHCSCEDIKPFCCRTGWKVVLVGSRFTHSAESRYAPIEGEALAVAYALDKARHFVLGCENLIITVDHKPLLGIFTNRSLDNIPNNRLRNLKEKTLRYRFIMHHIPGRRNCAPDSLSRHPSGDKEPNMTTLPDDIASIHCGHYSRPPPPVHLILPLRVDKSSTSVHDLDEDFQTLATFAISTISSVTWDMVKKATTSDDDMRTLVSTIETGFPSNVQDLPPSLRQYHQYHNNLSTLEGVAIYKDRIIIPTALRHDILDGLHAAHQGVTSMIALAESSVFWPGITTAIKETRARCHHCNTMASSQPHLPPTPPVYPEYPFQYICADYFSYKGNQYLISVDRYSNWPIIERSSEGSKGLINSLRRIFVTYGIPDELSSDGGPEFVAKNTKDFLNAWGVYHRKSSVAFPHSNCRAEIGVKTIKRMIVGNTGPHGELNTDRFQRAMLTYRNTPDPETNISPAMCIFGRPTRSTIPIIPGKYRPHPTWRETLQNREDALRIRHHKIAERLSLNTRRLPPLRVGNHVRIQNQIGSNPHKWDKTGLVIEVKQYDQYVVRVDGSGRVTLRNRKFLRTFTPVVPRKSLPIFNPRLVPFKTKTPQCHLPSDPVLSPPPIPDSSPSQDHTVIPMQAPAPAVLDASLTHIEDAPSPDRSTASRHPSPVLSKLHQPSYDGSICTPRRSGRPRKPPSYLDDYEH